MTLLFVLAVRHPIPPTPRRTACCLIMSASSGAPGENKPGALSLHFLREPGLARCCELAHEKKHGRNDATAASATSRQRQRRAAYVRDANVQSIERNWLTAGGRL
jgi:hypothetical protein